MTTAAEIAGEIVQAETDAVVAGAAAQTAVQAAETAVQMAQQQTAMVVADAADQIRDAVMSVEDMERELQWLREKTTALETANLATMAQMSSMETTILAMTVQPLVVSPSPAPLESTEVPPIPVASPQSADVVVQPVQENPPPQKPKARKFRRL